MGSFTLEVVKILRSFFLRKRNVKKIDNLTN